jgi:2-C-methyl-D-erythritol 2,4-cyclodiphosphate synthase
MFSKRQAQALREGDVGDQGGEKFFPNTETQKVEATGKELPSDPPIRIGHGYDIHAYLPRDSTEGWGAYNPQPTVIGGVAFEEFPLGVVANSDGDVIYHCVTDAILGALGLPDIGQFFPDNIPKWRGANSKEFFNEAVRLMELRKYQICNVDVTVIAEKPRLAARKPEMKANVVRLGHTIPARVNIKARTHEKLDSVGECRAIECHAVVVLECSSS